MEEKIFKAYDIRGIYPKEINEKIFQKIAKLLAQFFQKGKIVVGHDPRLSSSKLYQALIFGLKNNPKIKIIPLGLTSTPMFYFLVNTLKAKGGFMVTASHNPKNWNGLKIVKEKGETLSGKEVLKIIKKYEKKIS